MGPTADTDLSAGILIADSNVTGLHDRRRPDGVSRRAAQLPRAILVFVVLVTMPFPSRSFSILKLHNPSECAAHAFTAMRSACRRSFFSHSTIACHMCAADSEKSASLQPRTAEPLDPTTLHRKDLQALAKQHGVRANIKSSDIIAQLDVLGVFSGGSGTVSGEIAQGEASTSTDVTQLGAPKTSTALSEEVIAETVAQVDGLGRIEVEAYEYEVPCAAAKFGRFAAVSGDLCWAEPVAADAPLVNGAEVRGKLVLARRGSCSFVAKALRVQEAGGAGLVVVDSEGGGPLFRPGDPQGEGGSVSIPVVLVGLEDGELLGQGGFGEVSLMDVALLRKDFEAVADKEAQRGGGERVERGGSSSEGQRDAVERGAEGRREARAQAPAQRERAPNSRSRRMEVSLEGVKLKDIVQDLAEGAGFDEMFRRTGIRAFSYEPSVKSALKFLRAPGNEWARRKVEAMYLEEKRYFG